MYKYFFEYVVITHSAYVMCIGFCMNIKLLVGCSLVDDYGSSCSVFCIIWYLWSLVKLLEERLVNCLCCIIS